MSSLGSSVARNGTGFTVCPVLVVQWLGMGWIYSMSSLGSSVARNGMDLQYVQSW